MDIALRSTSSTQQECVGAWTTNDTEQGTIYIITWTPSHVSGNNGSVALVGPMGYYIEDPIPGILVSDTSQSQTPIAKITGSVTGAYPVTTMAINGRTYTGNAVATGGNMTLTLTDTTNLIKYVIVSSPPGPGQPALISATAYANYSINTGTGDPIQPGGNPSVPVPLNGFLSSASSHTRAGTVHHIAFPSSARRLSLLLSSTGIKVKVDSVPVSISSVNRSKNSSSSRIRITLADPDNAQICYTIIVDTATKQFISAVVATISNLPKEITTNSQRPLLVIKCNGQNKNVLMKKKGCGKQFSPMMVIDSISAAKDKDFGEMFMTIFDSVPHNGTYNGKHKSTFLGIRSQFVQFPQFNYITKGEGINLNQKFKSIIRDFGLRIGIKTFTVHYALYVYTVYSLARFLYGEFDTDVLARCFFPTFFRDLQDSPYSDFTELYTNTEVGLVGFQKYFDCICK